MTSPSTRRDGRGPPVIGTGTVLIVLGAGIALLLAVVGAVVALDGVSVAVYFRDPASTFDFTPLAGLISHAGVVALIAAGVIGWFAAAQGPAEAGLLRAAGAFGLLLAADDFLMLHERVFPQMLGIPELLVFAVYAALGLVIAVVFRHALRGPAHLGLYLAIGFLSASVLCDLIFDYSPQQAIFEDSLKFLGLLLWSAYWIGRAHLALGSTRRSP